MQQENSLRIFTTGRRIARRRSFYVGAAVIALTAPQAPAMAQDADAALEARVSAIEDKLERILERLEASPDALTAQEAGAIHEAYHIVQDPSGSAAAAPRATLAELDTPGGVNAQQTPYPPDVGAPPKKAAPKKATS